MEVTKITEEEAEKVEEASKKPEPKPLKISKVKLWQSIAGFFFVTTVLLLFFPISLFGHESGLNEQVPAQQDSAMEQEPNTDAESQEQNSEPERFEVSEDDDPFLGDENAPVVIIAFEDYQCPFCKRVNDDALQRVKEEYVETGKVKLVFRDFPLANIHPEAVGAALASECAHEQGKFWEYHDALYANQATLSVDLYKQLAADLELDTEQFNSCLETSKYAEEVQNDFNQGIQSGVDGTPAYFINGVKIVGSHPFENFQTIIEGELA